VLSIYQPSSEGSKALRLLIRRLDSNLPLPSYAHKGDAGLDLYAATTMTIAPGHRALIPTGVAVSLPEGYAGFVQPRSGRALREGLSFVNTPGLIDSHYRGEIQIIAVNLDLENTLTVQYGDKVAQLVVQRVEHCDLAEVDQLDETVRGGNGFGSTGT
jgi:dUTP pyrophosphatase